MLFNRRTMTNLVTFVALSNAVGLRQKRDDVQTDINLFGYGSPVNGYPVFYADGLAYIGRSAPSWAALATNITFTADSSSTSEPWTIAANSTDVSFNGTSAPEMYIVPTSGSFSQVGFTSSNSSLPTGATTTGFTFFGSSVAYAASDSNYELQFWANSTNTSDIYALYWNSDGTVLDGAFPITLKSTPPTILTTIGSIV